MHEQFVSLTVLTLGAAIIVWVLQRYGLSPILGYLTLGMLVTPFKPYLALNPDTVPAMAEIGVVLLLFFIGLEFHLSEVRHMLRMSLGAGGLQMILSSAAFGGLAWAMGLDGGSAAVVGFFFAISSTALVMKAYEDRQEEDTARARIALAVLLMQDIAAILAVAALPLLAAAPKNDSGGSSAADLFQRLGILVVGMPLLFLGCRKLLPWLFERLAIKHLPEAFSLLSLGACMLVALGVESAGGSLALGAFLGGLVLCETPFAAQIKAELVTLKNLALAFFFVTIGMLVDFRFLLDHAGWLVLALLLLVLIKTLLAGISIVTFGTPFSLALGVGLTLSQVGEFSFVLAQEARRVGVLDKGPGTFEFILAVAVGSMLVTPFLVAWSAPLVRWCSGRPPSEPPRAARKTAIGLAPLPPEAENLQAIVVGYGPVGKTLTRILNDFGIQPTIVDLNLETIRRLQGLGYNALYGDAGRREILAKAGVERVTYLLITLPDMAGRLAVVATAHAMNPSLKILTRARYLGERTMMEEAGAIGVSYEEAEVAVALARLLLLEIGAPAESIQKEGDRIRAEIAVRSGFTLVPFVARKNPPAPGG